MQKVKAAAATRGASATQWRIHTPICAPSRAELFSGRYFHNIASAETTPSPGASNGGVGHVNQDLVWPIAFPRLLREKGYITGE